MRTKLIISLMTVMMTAPLLTMAQHGSTYYDDNVTVYVNTEAFGVHKEYDSKRGCYVWRNSMGSFICLDKNMKPLHEMDKHVHFTGTNNDPDNPEVSPFSGIRKVWDQKRGCYVWKNIYTGDFLGTDKSSAHQLEKEKQKAQQKAKEKEKNQHKQSTAKKDQHNSQNQVGKQEQPKGKSNTKSSTNPQQLIITSDEELRQAEAAIREAKAQVAAAKAQGVDVNQYAPVDKYIKQAEDAINEYKRQRNMH